MCVANVRFRLGPKQTKMKDTEEFQLPLVKYYAKNHPAAKVQQRSANILGGSRNILSRQLAFYEFLVLDGRRVTVSELGMKAPNSLVQTKFNDCYYVGQVTKILTHRQAEVPGQTALVQVKWFVPFKEIDEEVSPWKD